jgi:TPR repeat protein
MRRALLALALSVAMTGAALAGTLDEARAAIESDDYAAALALWEPLAEEGNAEAQSGLGYMYHNGYGVARDYERALYWYRRAAEQGYALAQFSLGFHYERGLGIQRDLVQAYVWYSLAEDRTGGALRDLMVDNRERVAANLTLAQIAEAERLASEWLAAHTVAQH